MVMIYFNLLMVLVFLLFYFFVVTKGSFFNVMSILFLSFLFQIFVLILSVFVSYYFCVLMELGSIFFLLKVSGFFSLDEGFSGVLSIFFFSFLIIFFIIYIGETGEFFLCCILVFLFTFKSFWASLVVLCMSDFSGCCEGKFFVFYYLFNTKVLYVFLGLIFLSVDVKSVMMFVFNGCSCSFFCLMWLFLVLISWFFLIKEDFRGFIVASFCLSQFLLVFSLFLSMSLFFLGLFVEVILMGFFLFSFSFKMDIFDGFKGDSGVVVFFIFSCQVVGIPPFPAFYLEINFLSIFYYCFGINLGLFFIFFIYLFLLFQFIFLCSILMSSSLKLYLKAGSGGVGYLEEFWFIFYFLFFMFLFIFCFYGFL